MFETCNFISVLADISPSCRANMLPAGAVKNSQFYYTVFADRPSFREGLRRKFKSRNFTSVFADRPLFCAKGLPRTTENRNFTAVC